MTILEALKNALTLLEMEGYTGSDVHDDLELAISRLQRKFPVAAEDQL